MKSGAGMENLGSGSQIEQRLGAMREVCPYMVGSLGSVTNCFHNSG